MCVRVVVRVLAEVWPLRRRRAVFGAEGMPAPPLPAEVALDGLPAAASAAAGSMQQRGKHADEDPQAHTAYGDTRTKRPFSFGRLRG